MYAKSNILSTSLKFYSFHLKQKEDLVIFTMIKVNRKLDFTSFDNKKKPKKRLRRRLFNPGVNGNEQKIG